MKICYFTLRTIIDLAGRGRVQRRELQVPEISRFYGIVIGMFFSEHNPPHFHVRYAEYKAAVGIRNLSLLEGHLPPRVLGLVIEWAARHQEDLLADWLLAQQDKEPRSIEPLE